MQEDPARKFEIFIKEKKAPITTKRTASIAGQKSHQLVLPMKWPVHRP